MKQRSKNMIIYFLGILTGFGFYYFKTLCTFKENAVYKDDIANITISTEENLRFKVISISKGSNPLIKFELDKMNRVVEKAAIYDEKNRMVGRFYVTDGTFSSIEMLTEGMLPFFQMVYDDKMQRWHQATYCKKTEADKLIGDFNEDINIDGQFDITKAFDNKGNYIGSLIFFNNSWNSAISLSEDGLSAEIVTNAETKETLKLLFDFKKGWIPEK